jgi:biofilm protein TabA
MAVFGDLTDVRGTLAALALGQAHFEAAFAYLEKCLQANSAERQGLNALAPDTTRKVDLSGSGLFTVEQAYFSKPFEKCFYESHLRHIDLQLIVAGEEIMDVQPIRNLTVDKPFQEARDLITYRYASNGSRLRIAAGQLAVFFPSDGHMPGQQADGSVLVRKTVVKVPIG